MIILTLIRSANITAIPASWNNYILPLLWLRDTLPDWAIISQHPDGMCWGVHVFQRPRHWRATLLFCPGHGRFALQCCATGCASHHEPQLHQPTNTHSCKSRNASVQWELAKFTCPKLKPTNPQGGEGELWKVPEWLKDCIHETSVPQVPKACGTKGSGASLQWEQLG